MIFRDLATTGDGLLTGVQLLDLVARTGRPLSELAAEVDDPAAPGAGATCGSPTAAARHRRAPSAAEIAAEEAALGGRGRVLVRPSGTEPLVRVMVEAADAGHRRGRRRSPGRRGPRPLRRLSRRLAARRLLAGGGPRLVRVPITGRRATALVGPFPGSLLRMCGIIAVVRRRAPAAADPARASTARLRGRRPLLVELGAGATLPTSSPPRSPTPRPRSPAVDRAAAGRPRRARPARRPRAWPPPSPTRSSGSTADASTLERRLDADAALAGAELEHVNAALIRAEGRRLGRRPRPPPHRPRPSRDLGRAPTPAAAGRRRLSRPAGAVGPRPPRGARPRLAPASTCSCATTASTSTPPAVAPLLAGRGRRPAASARGVGARRRRATSRFVYKAAAEIGELGDNTARAARRHPRRRACCAWPCAARRAEAVVLGHTRWASVGIISEPNAHPLNAEELDGAGGPYVTARAQRRRRQLRRPQGRRGPAHRRRDHHRRQGHPHARVARASPPAHDRRSRPSAARWPRSRARSPSAASAAAAPDAPAARPARQRPGALRRSRRGRLHRRQRALRRGRGDRPTTCASTARPRPTPSNPPPAAARSSCSTATGPARSTGIAPLRLRRHRSCR